MSLTLELPAEVERELRAEAARRGVEPQRVVVDALEQRAADRPPTLPRVTGDGAKLLKRINLGFSEEWWSGYAVLKEMGAAGTLAAEERAQLIRMSDELENANARRFAALIELARLRGTTLSELMCNLGLGDPGRG